MRIGSATVLIGSGNLWIRAYLDMIQENLQFNQPMFKLDPEDLDRTFFDRFQPNYKLDPCAFLLNAGSL